MNSIENKATEAPNKLVLLIYTSLAVRDMSKDELIQILSKARENNKRLNISGVLLYKEGNFLQVLEGPDEVVKERFEIIRQDPRHHEVTMLLKRPIAKRDFAHWEMGFTNMTEDDAKEIVGFSPYLLQTIEKNELVQPNTVAEVFLEAFRQVMR
jgi:CRISPR/Cas system CMR-associated protein Cmr3 (group 5 of RAMP superfamily)